MFTHTTVFAVSVRKVTGVGMVMKAIKINGRICWPTETPGLVVFAEPEWRAFRWCVALERGLVSVTHQRTRTLALEIARELREVTNWDRDADEIRYDTPAIRHAAMALIDDYHER